MNLIESSLDALANIADAQHPNEFAYFALTTKIECPLRDRWAYLLHSRLGDAVEVSREWCRTDLALLVKGEPKALIEIKAMYTFDAVETKQIERYCKAMKDDEDKARKLAPDADVLTVLLVTDPQNTILSSKKRMVKYDRGINAMILRHGSPEAVRKHAIELLTAHLAQRNVIAHGNLPVGSAFGVNVEILYWVVAAASNSRSGGLTPAARSDGACYDQS